MLLLRYAHVQNLWGISRDLVALFSTTSFSWQKACATFRLQAKFIRRRNYDMKTPTVMTSE